MSFSKWLNEYGYKTVKSLELGRKIPDLVAYNKHEIVAFEEKKNAEEIQSAIGQCLHYLEEANKAFIILPSEEINKLSDGTLKIIKKCGIGLLSKGKNTKVIIHAKRFGKLKKEVLEKIRIKEFSLKKTKKQKKSMQLSGINEKDILKILEKYPKGMKIADVSKALRTPRQTVSKYIYALESAGKVVHFEVGRAKLYFLKRREKR
jgi:uncharacterized membrane protein